MFRLPTPRAIWRSLPGRWANHAESAQVATLLAACHALDVAPAPMLEAWARDSRGRQGRRLTQAARHLQSGGPLAAVPDRVPGLMRDEHAVAVRFGGMTGLVVPIVRATLAAEAGAEAEARLRIRGLVRWAIAWSILALLVTMFLATKIAPQTKKIWDDFDAHLPIATARWLEACAWLAACRWLVVPLAVMGLVFRFSPAVRQAFAQPFTRRRRIAAALDTLAVAVAAGQPIHAAAATLAACQTDGRLALRLADYGTRLPEQDATAGLLTAAEGRELDAAPAAAAATLARIAARRRDALRRRTTLWQRVISLGMIALAGGFVFWTAIAFFMPLIELTELVAGVRP